MLAPATPSIRRSPGLAPAGTSKDTVHCWPWRWYEALQCWPGTALAGSCTRICDGAATTTAAPSQIGLTPFASEGLTSDLRFFAGRLVGSGVSGGAYRLTFSGADRLAREAHAGGGGSAAAALAVPLGGASPASALGWLSCMEAGFAASSDIGVDREKNSLGCKKGTVLRMFFSPFIAFHCAGHRSYASNSERCIAAGEGAKAQWSKAKAQWTGSTFSTVDWPGCTLRDSLEVKA